MSQRLVILGLAAVALLAVAVLPVEPQSTTSTTYPCGIDRVYAEGQTVNASRMNSLQVKAMQTGMVPACVDDDSADVATMNTTADPYPSSVASLPTNLKGELERLRHVVKQLTGWTQWYTHTENLNFGTRTLTLTALTANSFLYSGAGGLLTTTAAPTNGQLLIGSTGVAPVRAALTGTANQITVTNGAGTITLATPQDLATGSSPTFAAVTVNPFTDIVQFYSATSFCHADSTNLVKTRVAANDWALARTAAGAETYAVRCDLPAPTRTTSGKGWKLASFKIAQQITTQALTSNTFNALSTTTYVDNVANAVAGYGGAVTITMPTATQANPYLTSATLGTAAFMNTADVSIGMDFTVVMQNLGVYRLYGISATWTHQP